MELALPLLDEIAPDVEPPVAYRAGADPPTIVESDDPLARAFDEAARLAAEEGLLAVIAPPSLRADMGDAAPTLFDETRIPLLTPREAKGLEFDHVVVVEPALIVDEAVEGQGLRELYVALTRPTKSLVVVHCAAAAGAAAPVTQRAPRCGDLRRPRQRDRARGSAGRGRGRAARTCSCSAAT